MHERIARIERVEGDAQGRFMMTLATEGEASDGDILSIKGGKIPARMPLLLSHFNDPTQMAGSVVEPVKDLDSKPPRLRAVAEFELGGEGVFADIRRDVAFMIEQGHGGAVSIRWDEVPGGKPPIRRVNLSKDHAAFVDAETETSWRKRSGMFWPEWQGLEGSIVAVAADQKAFVDRQRATEGRVSAFWGLMADDAVERDDGTADVQAALAGLALHADECRDLGATPADVINAAVAESDALIHFDTIKLAEKRFVLPHDAVEEIEAMRRDADQLIQLEMENRANPEDTAADRQAEVEEETEPDRAPEEEESADQPTDAQPFNQREWVNTLRRLLDEQDASIRDEIKQLMTSLAEAHDSGLRDEFKRMLDNAQGRVR